MSGTLSGVYAPTYPSRTDADLKIQREREGRCALCGLQTHKVKKSLLTRRKVPLTIPGEVYRGRCLFCFPIVVNDAQAVAVNGEEEEVDLGITVEAMQVAQQEEVLEAQILSTEPLEEQQEAPVAVQLITPIEQQLEEEISTIPTPPPSAPPMSPTMTTASISSHEQHQPQPQPQPFQIIVASKSKMKLRAVSETFSQNSTLHDFNDMKGVNLPSTGLPAEPIGKKEIVATAIRRINIAKQIHCADNNDENDKTIVWVGIQSGVINSTEIGDDYNYENSSEVITRDMYDIGCIVLQIQQQQQQQQQQQKQFVIWTDTLAIPNPLPSNMKRGPNGEWSELKDPHSVLTDGSRSKLDFLRDALRQFLEENNDLF